MFEIIIEILMGIFIITAIYVMITIPLEYIKDKWGTKEIDRTHHDSRPGSHYQISQQALRDARKDYLK